MHEWGAQRLVIQDRHPIIAGFQQVGSSRGKSAADILGTKWSAVDVGRLHTMSSTLVIAMLRAAPVIVLKCRHL